MGKKYLDHGGLAYLWSKLKALIPRLDMSVDGLIPDGSDLDDYTTPGTYYVPASTNSATMAHTPNTGVGFRLIVLQNHDNYATQLAVCNSNRGYVYFRRCNLTVPEWSTWARYYNTESAVPISGGGTGATTATAALLALAAFDLGVGTVLPSNADLNDYMTPGTYCCSSASDAAKIANTPNKSQAYKLVVMQITTNRYWQIAFNNSTTTYIYTRAYTGSWGAWRRVSTSTYTP